MDWKLKQLDSKTLPDILFLLGYRLMLSSLLAKLLSLQLQFLEQQESLNQPKEVLQSRYLTEVCKKRKRFLLMRLTKLFCGQMTYGHS